MGEVKRWNMGQTIGRYCFGAPVLWALPLVAATVPATAWAEEVYRLPPQVVVDVLDRPPTPDLSLGPRGAHAILIHRAGMPGIEDLAEPSLRLAGRRVNPRTNGPADDRRGRIPKLEVLRMEDGSALEIQAPRDPNLGTPLWSPDGRRIAFTQTRPSGIELWVAEVESGRASRVTEANLNLASGSCEWLPDSAHLLCRFVPDGRRAAPSTSGVPAGPVIQETTGARAQVRSFQDLLGGGEDVRKYEHYLTSQLAVVPIRGARRSNLGRPGIFGRTETSPDGRLILVERIVPPYSYLVPDSYFPRIVEVWNREGEVVFRLADLPLAEAVPIWGVRTGPRGYGWRPGEDSTLVWVEALDDGDPKKEVEFRDRMLTLKSPFRGEPVELFRCEGRFRGADWGRAAFVFLSEIDREKQWTRTWHLALDDDRPSEPRLVFDRGMYDAYGDPGDLLTWPDAAGRRVVLEKDGSVFLTGNGSSPDGDRPFLDRLHLATLESERLFQSVAETYEWVLAPLDESVQSILTRFETVSQPPNYFSRDLRDGSRRALTEFPNPTPELEGVRKQLVTYWREDGIELSGTLYLPAGYQPGERLPAVLWAYPREFNDPRIASQVRGSPHRFTVVSGASQLFFLTQGYAVLDGPAMPIVGEEGNDTFVEQLVMSAKAAVDKLVSMGVADPQRIGIGGHSYGAFMTANLLAHCDLFAAGIGRSGAYNRTLTPFGFQNERRTFWEAPDVYFILSPFMHADRIKAPLLLIHGETDNNAGTFPLQSQRLFHALKGLGGNARLVMLPHESHGYAARESVMHALAEMIDWFGRHVKRKGRAGE
jgi:dipeptidyl aminopeptidase/acylaminoacyl peptidase